MVAIPTLPHAERWFCVVWGCGPAAYGASYLACLQWPEFCDDPPNLGLALMLTASHVAAGLMTLPLAVTRGTQWRWPEFWLLLPYWGGLAGWLVVPDVTPHGAFVSARVAAVVAGVITVLFVGRMVRRYFRPRGTGAGGDAAEGSSAARTRQ